MIYRLTAVFKKEMKTVLKDKIFLLILLILPLAALAIFGYTFQQNIDNLPTIIIDQDNSDYSFEVIKAAENSEYFNVLSVNKISLEDSLKKVRNSEVRAIIHIKEGFEKNLDDAISSDIYLYVDSSDYTIYNTLKAAIGGVIKDSLQEISLKIIGELELEKDKNIHKVEEIKNLSDEIEGKIDSMKEGVEDINNQFENFRVLLDDAESKIENVSTQLIQLNISMNINDILDINEFRGLLDENEIKSKKIKRHSDELFVKYDNITGTVDSVDLQFKTLKKEFLTHPIELKDSYLFGEISYFNYLTAGVLSLILFFILVLLTSINIIDEKEKNTLYRLSTTPLKKSELLIGKFLTFLLVGIFEGVWFVLFTIFLFNVDYVGSLFNVFIIITLLSAVSVSVGLLVSVLVRTMRQALLIIPGLLMPVLLMSQTFAPIEVMPKFMQEIAKLTPTFYVNVALRDVMIKGSSLGNIWYEILILVCYISFVLTLGILLLKKRIS